MTYEELLKQICPFAKPYINTSICPSYLFGNVAPEFDPSRCRQSLCEACWRRQVPPEVLAAHGIKEVNKS